MTLRVWLNKASQKKHTDVISTRIKKQSITSTPRAPDDPSTTKQAHSNRYPGIQSHRSFVCCLCVVIFDLSVFQDFCKYIHEHDYHVIFFFYIILVWF